MLILGGNKAAENEKDVTMKKDEHATEISRGDILAAIRVIDDAAETQRNLHDDTLKLLIYEDADGFPSANVQTELNRRGLKWDIDLNGVSLAPFAYAPAFHSERQENPEKWPDARDTAINELEIMRMPYDDDDEEYMAALAKQEKLAEVAIDAAEATIEGLHEILRNAKERWKYLRVLEAEAITKLRIPFTGFYYDKSEHVLHACFKEGSGDFRMLVPLDENAGCWEETGVEEVDELLWGLGCDLPELLPNDTVDVMSAEANKEKSFGFSEDEAIAIVKDFLAS